MSERLTAIDLFSGCGGMSTGLESAGFDVLLGIECDSDTAMVYKDNHPNTQVIIGDIRDVTIETIRRLIGDRAIDLVAGCPPCQGFSTMRRRNRSRTSRDLRNNLILEYLRIVKEIKPRAVLLENVPALQDYYLFPRLTHGLEEIGYKLVYRVLDAQEYSVPQRRKRFVMIGLASGQPTLPEPCFESVTVRDAISSLPSPDQSNDALHKMHSRHGERISKTISQIPHDGGSLSDIPEEFGLKCHRKPGIGFRDVYGRMSWDKVSPTITGGCLNPSKGRFLHPDEDRGITAREAAMLQTFPPSYTFASCASRQKVALMIGNALPPKFAEAQGNHIRELLAE